MSSKPDGKQPHVITWNGMYLTSVAKGSEVPEFSWAPMKAKVFEDAEAAQAFIRQQPKMPKEATVVRDPIKGR